ncbi:dihydroorotase [Pectinatus brassicae]|uniref:Dihydroorotase n=1 Tax=Pectinatus brassicae TaxID=862415 RepID=A0A840UPQ3_9FIRM|nr:dihydroorotase [Pectinatus brassicae]MBB5336182.1 dihydroorotase [Pectinatus brassicae]
MKLLIKGGRIIDPANKMDKVADILIEDGKISKIRKDIKADDAEIIDAAGKIVTPGLIDMHTHMREPGQEAKEDLASGSRAAAAGGYTTIATMPNTKPVIDNAILIKGLQEKAKEEAVVNIEIIGALTKGQKGEELAEVGDMTEAGAIAFSDDGHYVDKAKVLLNGLDYLKTFNKIIISHAEETSLVEDGAMNEGHKSAMLGMKGRPSVAEDIAVMRDILLAEYAQAPIHIAHISTKNAVDFVRQAKKRGVQVTAEATPHNLTMTEDMVNLADSSTKVNPPLRTDSDVNAVLNGLLDGTIDAIVTDHAPHAVEEKDREYKYAPSGFPGLETALGVLLTDLYHTGKADLPLIIEKMSSAPAKIFGLNKGTLSKDAVADITIIDPDLEWTVDKDKFYTKGSHSPFVGRKLKGKAISTIVAGRIIMQNGIIIK